MTITSKILGPLNPVDYDPDWYESTPFPIPYFDNRAIKIVFVEPKHEPYLVGADDCVQNFLRLTPTDKDKGSSLVMKYYEEVLKYGYTAPLDIKSFSDIWNFVYPNEIFVEWDEKGDFYLIVSCGCDWEEEHGLQLVFPNGKALTRASGHDGGYTDE